MKNDRHVNICYITDNGYVQHTLVSMASLMSQRFPSTLYRIIVVCDNVDKDLKNMMKSFQQDGVEVVPIDYDNRVYSKKEYEAGEYISSATYIRLKLPSILKSLDRIIYLDGDTIIQDDLSELFNLDLGDTPMGGSLDFGICVDALNWSACDYIRNTLPGYEKHYVNAGVLVMDLKKMRKMGFETICQNLYEERRDFIFADQDIINWALKENKTIFPIYWNCPILSFIMNYAHQSKEFVKQKMEELFHITYDDVYDVILKAGIIHINGRKHFIQQIPFLDALYRNYLNLAIQYANRGRRS